MYSLHIPCPHDNPLTLVRKTRHRAFGLDEVRLGLLYLPDSYWALCLKQCVLKLSLCVTPGKFYTMLHSEISHGCKVCLCFLKQENSQGLFGDIF